MTILDHAGTYGADTRPARQASGRKLWAKDPSSAEANDGTRLDATFVNDLVGLVRGLLDAYGITPTGGDDTLLADAVAAAVAPKVNTADIINALSSTAVNQPLAAAQGKALKDLIDANNPTVHEHAIADVVGLEARIARWNWLHYR